MQIDKKYLYALIVLVIIIVIYNSEFIISNKAVDLNKEVELEQKASEVLARGIEHKGVLVYVTGAVESPGLYEMGHPTSVAEVIKMSGGLLPYADINSLNLAEEVKGGTHLHIAFNFKGNPEELLRTKLININSATEDELVKVKGIGPTTAKKIIAYRTKKGKFNSIEEIKKVKGIGDGLFKKIKNSITV